MGHVSGAGKARRGHAWRLAALVFALVFVSAAAAAPANAAFTLSGPFLDQAGTQPANPVTEPSTGTTPVYYIATCSAGLLQNVHCVGQFSAQSGTAIAGVDFQQVTAGTFDQTVNGGIFGASTSVPFEVDIKSDGTDENAETFTASLPGATGSPITTTINDSPNDLPPAISIGDASIVEGTGGDQPQMTFPVTIDHVSGKQISATFTTGTTGSATSGTDFVAKTTTVTIEPGATSTTVHVLINPDSVPELDETFPVTLSNPVNATLGDANGVGTIIDDDPPTVSINDVSVAEGGQATLTVHLSSPTSQTVTVPFSTANGTAIAGTPPAGDYTSTSGTVTFLPGEVNKPITVNTAQDQTDEVDETFLVNLGTPTHAVAGDTSGTVTIVDDDTAVVQFTSDLIPAPESAGDFQVPITLSTPSSRDVHVSYRTVDIFSATPDVDYTAIPAGQVTIPAGQTAATITVHIVDDTVYEPDNPPEFFGLQITAADTSVGSPDGTFIVIQDNDAPPAATLQSDVTVDEHTGGLNNAVLTVQLDHLSDQDVVVPFSTANGTAVAPGDYTSTSSTVTIPAGQLAATFSIPIATDSTDENDESFSVVLGDPTGGTLGAKTSATVTITDDDAPPNASVAAATATEGGGDLHFIVTLTAPSAKPVKIGWTTANGSAVAGSDFTGGSGTLTIVPGIIGGEIVIPVTDDNVDEADETMTLTIAPTSDNSVAVPPAGATATGTIKDNNDAPPSVSLGPDVSVTEGNSGTGLVNVAVGLSHLSGHDVTVGYTTVDGSAHAPGDYTATSGILTIPAGQPGGIVQVPVVGDTAVEPDENFTLHIGNPTVATLGGRTVATVTIVNDDQPATTTGGTTTGGTTTGGTTGGTTTGGTTGGTTTGSTTGSTTGGGANSGDVTPPQVSVKPLKYKRSTHRLSVSVSCPGEARCTATVSVLTVPSKKSKIKSLRKELKLGTSDLLVIPQGKSATFTLKLSKKVQKLLKQARKIKVKAFVVAYDRAGNNTTKTGSGTLKR